MIRIFPFVLVFASLHLYAQVNVSERKVTAHARDITLEEAFELLRDAAAVEFAYSDDIVPLGTKVSLIAEDQPLKEVLENLLKQVNLEFKITNNRIIIKHASLPLTQTIRGVVTDKHTSLPIPGASIVLLQSQPVVGTISNADGKFKLDSIPVGRVSLSVSCVGFEPVKVVNVLLGTGKELVLTIPLAESVTLIKEVVVTADRFEAISLSNATVSSHPFSVDETKRYAGSLADPARMVSGFAGITGVSDESNALIVRGNSPRGILWRIEGMEVPNPNHFTTEGSSSGVVSVLSPNVIDYSEFLTGAFPAQYGNALSAVFDINLRTGNNEKHEHSFQAGLLGIEASTEGPFNKGTLSSYLVNYRYSSLSVADKLGFDLNEAGQYRDYQDLSFKVNFPLAGRTTLSVYGIGGTSRSNKETLNNLDDNGSDTGITGFTLKKVLNDKTFLDGGVSFSATRIFKRHEILNLNEGPLKLEENYVKTYARTNIGIRKKISPLFHLDAGFICSRLFYNFYLENLDPSNAAYQQIINFREKGNTGIIQAYAQGKNDLSSKVSVAYGIHFLSFNLTRDHALEPRFGLQWQVAPGKVIAAAYGKHSRIENLQYYLARDHQEGGNEVQVNRNLGFTRAHHFVLNYQQQFSGHHLFKAETYFQQLYNAPVQSDPSPLYVAFNEESGFVTDTLLNNGHGTNYGLELSLEKAFTEKFYYLLNGTIYRSVFGIGNDPDRSTSFDGCYAVHLLAGREMEMRHGKDRLGINGKITSAGGRRYVPINLERSIENGYTTYDWDHAFEKSFPDYFRIDLQFTYRKNKPRYAVEWRLDIQNITNHRNAAYYVFDPGSENIVLKKQTGILPLLSYRIEF